MPIGFGRGHQYKGRASGDGAPRKPLTDGVYPIELSFSVRNWDDGRGDKLQLTIRNADDEGSVGWLPLGQCELVNDDGTVYRRIYPSMDGQTETKEGPMLVGTGSLSSKTKGAAFLTAFQVESGLPDERMFDLRNTRPNKCRIKMVPNQHSKSGGKDPMLVDATVLTVGNGVNAANADVTHSGNEETTKKTTVKKTSKSAKPTTAKPAKPAKPTGVQLNDVQEKAKEGLVAYLKSNGALDTSDSSNAAEKLVEYYEGKSAERWLYASNALSDKVLAQPEFYCSGSIVTFRDDNDPF